MFHINMAPGLCGKRMGYHWWNHQISLTFHESSYTWIRDGQ